MDVGWGVSWVGLGVILIFTIGNGVLVSGEVLVGARRYIIIISI